MTRIIGGRFRLAVLAASLAVAIASGMSMMPARADAGILGDIGKVASFASSVSKFYDLFDQYILGHQPLDLQQVQAVILQSRDAIISQIDAVASADVQACAATAVEQFGNIEKMNQTTLQAFVASNVACVNKAEFDIDAETDRAAIDNIGFALNIVAPIALFTSADAGQSTDVLKQAIIIANQHLIAKLKPTCDVSILSPDDLPSVGEGLVTGHGACFNYRVPTPPRVDTDVFYVSAGPNVAFLPWYYRGNAVPRDPVFPWRGYDVFWPVQNVDFSIAADDVLAATSAPIADAALYRLADSVAVTGSPIAAGASTVSYAPVELVRVNGQDETVSRNEVHHGDETLSGWTGMGGRVRTVTEASNADGRVEMFGIDKTGRVFHRWQAAANDDTSWSRWAELTGQQLSSLAVARNDNGTLELFGTTPSGQIFTSSQVLSRNEFQADQPLNPLPAIDHWTDWQQMDGQLRKVAAGVNANGRLELFGLDSTGKLVDRQQTAVNATDPSIAGSWTGWSQLPGPRAFTSIAVAADLGGSLNVFATDSAGTVWQSYQQGQNTEQWSPWTAISGRAVSNLAAATESGGAKRLDLFGIDPSGHTWLNSNDGIHGDAWRGWTPVSDTPAANPSVTVANQNTNLGTPVNIALSVSGGTAPYTLTISGLPPGLFYNSSQIFGTPTAPGTFNASITVTDAVGQSGSASFTWTVNGATVPNVLYDSRADAVSAITAAGLVANVSFQKRCTNPGDVLTQDPGGGTVLAPGSTVRITVDSGTISTCQLN